MPELPPAALLVVRVEPKAEVRVVPVQRHPHLERFTAAGAAGVVHLQIQSPQGGSRHTAAAEGEDARPPSKVRVVRVYSAEQEATAQLELQAATGASPVEGVVQEALRAARAATAKSVLPSFKDLRIKIE